MAEQRDEQAEGDLVDAADVEDLDDEPADELADAGPEDGLEDGLEDDVSEDDSVDDQPARRRLVDRIRWTPLLLLQSAHAKQAILTALAMGGVAILTDRPAREVGIITVTVLIGQAILGWHNDIVDRERDEAHQARGKPIADGRLDPGSAWYAIVVAALVLVPLAVTTGITAGGIYLVSVCVGMLGNVMLRTGFLSWATWAISFAMLPAYLSYGGWGGQAVGDPPETSITILAALLGIGVHFMRAVWGLVGDHEDGWTYLPLKLGLKLGATRLLALATLYTIVIVVLLGYFGARDGLSR